MEIKVKVYVIVSTIIDMMLSILFELFNSHNNAIR